MRKLFISIVLILFFNSAFGQIIFQKGYFIDTANQRINCLIKNADWRNNPKEFKYKFDDNDSLRKATISMVKEFQVEGYPKYIGISTKIDRSPEDLTKLSKEKAPVWVEEQLFLEVLVDGKAKLYYYCEDNFNRFFYSIDNSSIKQLICKMYMFEDSSYATNINTFLVNDDYKRQLNFEVKCESTSNRTLERLAYDQSSLESYFRGYNKCKGDTSISQVKAKRNVFNLKITPGITYSKMDLIPNLQGFSSISYGNDLGYRMGLEGEVILPFNKNKWSILIEPSYHYYSNSNIDPRPYAQAYNLSNYSAIEFPFGIRYYMFINKELKIFINGLFVPSATIPIKSEIVRNSAPIQSSPTYSFAFGSGIDYGRYSGEIRYYSSRDLTFPSNLWMTDYQRIYLVLGYKLLRVRK